MSFMFLTALCAAFLSVGSAHQYPTHGTVGTLSQSCLSDLNNIFNDYYLLTSTADSEDNRPKPWTLLAPRRMGCRLVILEALESATADGCPADDLLINCFWVAAKSWISLVKKCELFKSQVPLPACSDASGESAEGIPSCTGPNANTVTTRRRLLQGPANDAGIATWQYSNGEAVGLQYDPYAPAGSLYAQPPLAANLQGVTACKSVLMDNLRMIEVAPGVNAAALGATNEGSEGGSVSSNGAIQGASGCFPSFWSAADFQSWLNGTFIEIPRPKDYGSVNVLGLVSVWVYTILLCSLAFF